MKIKLLLLTFLLCTSISAMAQNKWIPKLGYGTVYSGNGDIPGHWFIGGMQTHISKRSGFEILATGTYIEQTRRWGQGYETFQKSNGVALEGSYNLFINAGPVQIYPAVGPVLRYASERELYGLSIQYNGQGGITDFEPEMRSRNELQAGYVLALNLDVKAKQHLTFGLRGSVQSFHTGQRLAAVGLTLKNARW
ncbi:hypothetical protein [Pontibacter lucknowensis]|uniref:Outer membrane protein beta-barrel domain-containing protein n=1 Tax=Pontibacter lucknowensis TaxID=1077936 RepID=A0A1N6YB30_9BACT|nr:hypothetical protein [Pontibacter lucknowensis]SIR11689.1 hypothetical protein SAMN05421545_2385 [Pontibacter lucknowensis]